MWVKVRKTLKIRERYNQVPYLTKGTTCESNKKTITTTNKSQKDSPFPAGDYKAAMNGRKEWEKQDTKTQMIHKRSTALEQSVKIFYWRA